MIKELTKIANELDARGLSKESDFVDKIIKLSGKRVVEKIGDVKIYKDSDWGEYTVVPKGSTPTCDSAYHTDDMEDAVDTAKAMSKEASYLDSLINKGASFIPKKIKPFRAKITGGRFEGGQGMAVDEYDDGVFGIDLDEPMHDSARGFAMEDQIERIDATDALEGDASSFLEKEVSEGPSLTWVNRGDWGDAKADLRKHEVRPEHGTEGLDRMEQRDLDAIQSALDQDPESEAGYLVINPWDAADFRMFVQDQMDHPEGKQIAVPLSTFEVEGKRINFFKINDWTNPKGDRFGKVEQND